KNPLRRVHRGRFSLVFAQRTPLGLHCRRFFNGDVTPVATTASEKLKVDDALAVGMARVFCGFGLSVLKRGLALLAGAFGLLAAAADQFYVAHGSAVAQMSGDGEVVHRTDCDFLAHSPLALLKSDGLSSHLVRMTRFFVSTLQSRARVGLEANKIVKSHHRSIFLTINS